jgi:hypothetical protein
MESQNDVSGGGVTASTREGEEIALNVTTMQCDVENLPHELHNILRNQPDYIEITSKNEKYADSVGFYKRFPYYQKINLVNDSFDNSNWRFIIHKDVINGEWQLSGLNDGGSHYPMIWSKRITNFYLTQEEEKEALSKAREQIMDPRILNLQDTLESKQYENEVLEKKLQEIEYLQKEHNNLTEQNEEFEKEEEKVNAKLFKKEKQNKETQAYEEQLMLEIEKQDTQIEILVKNISKIENLYTQQNKTYEVKMSMMKEIQNKKIKKLDEKYKKNLKDLKIQFQNIEEKKENESLTKQILNMKESNKQLEKNIENLDKEQKQLEQTIDDLKMDEKQLQKNVSDEKKSKNDLQVKYNVEEQKKKELQKIAKSMKDIKNEKKKSTVLDFENLPQNSNISQKPYSMQNFRKITPKELFHTYNVKDIQTNF